LEADREVDALLFKDGKIYGVGHHEAPARRPAFADSGTMALLRADCLVVSAYNSRSSMLASDRIFACLPAMIQTNQTMSHQYTIKLHLIKTTNNLLAFALFLAS
jgi:hypothetical protein